MHPIFKVSGKISPYFRRRRFRHFLNMVAPTKSMRILDIGGLPRACFDLVYSNSVIEHLGTWEKQQAFAAEARRVGRGYWIPTPGQGVSS